MIKLSWLENGIKKEFIAKDITEAIKQDYIVYRDKGINCELEYNDCSKTLDADKSFEENWIILNEWIEYVDINSMIESRK